MSASAGILDPAIQATVPGQPRVLRDLREATAFEWDGLVPHGAAGLRQGFLRAWERAELAGRMARPIVVPAADGRRLAAAVAGYHYDLDLATVSAPFLSEAVQVVRRLWPRLMMAQVYELGAPVARHDPLLLGHGVKPAAVAGPIVAAAVREARQAGSSMIIAQDVIPSDGSLAAALRRHGFGRVVTLPTFVVQTQYESFEAYLGALRSKYRRRARCVLRDSRHLRVELIDDFVPLAEEMARLWRLVYDRAHETKREVMGAEFFLAAAELECCRALVLRRADGSIAGFGLLMEDGHWLHFLQCGFGEAAGRSEAVYFRLLLEIMRLAIEGDFAVAHLGCTTTGPKLDLGAVPVPLSAWLRHRNPMLQKLFVTGGNSWFAPPAAAPRRVFAEDQA